MKFLCIIFCLVTCNSILAKTPSRYKKRTKYTYPLGTAETLGNSIQLRSVKEFKSLELLKTTKYLIINGELEKAKILLKEATIATDFSKKIQLRYLATIHFIEGNYLRATDILSSEEMNGFTDKGHYCVLNTISQLILNQIEQAKTNWKSCRDATLANSKSNLFWIETIIKLKANKDIGSINKLFQDLFIENQEGDSLRIFLKLSLYLNKQKSIIPRFQYFNSDTIKNPLYRELIGMNYYRNFDMEKAFQFLENLDGPNAEVFKGNLYLFQKKYDIAYAQYKLALKRKDNSSNALERLMPLAWRLGQWEEGIDYVQNFTFNKNENLYKYSLLAAFLTMNDKPKIAEKVLNKISNFTNKGEPIEVTQLQTLNNVLLKNMAKVERSTYQTCLKKDGMHCWFLYYLGNFDEPLDDLNIENKNIHHPKSVVDFYTASKINNPLSQEVFVDQKDIEELDNQLIQLVEIPKS